MGSDIDKILAEIEALPNEADVNASWDGWDRERLDVADLKELANAYKTARECVDRLRKVECSYCGTASLAREAQQKIDEK